MKDIIKMIEQKAKEFFWNDGDIYEEDYKNNTREG